MDEDQNKSKVSWWQPGVLLFMRLSGWIAGPIIIAIFAGKWLDSKYGTDPWLFLLTVGFAFIVSTMGIVRDSMKELKRVEKEQKKKDGE